MYVHGPTSFKVLRTTDDGIVHDTFYAAAAARGLLADDNMWVKTVESAMGSIMKKQQRLYWLCIFLATNVPLDPEGLVRKNLHYLAPGNLFGDENRFLYVLRRFEFILRRRGIIPEQGRTACEQIGLPYVNFGDLFDNAIEVNKLIN